jgi:hypothetical protein
LCPIRFAATSVNLYGAQSNWRIEMMRSRREAGNRLISGYKKAEEVARKKVVTEVSGFSVQVSVFLFFFPDT